MQDFSSNSEDQNPAPLLITPFQRLLAGLRFSFKTSPLIYPEVKKVIRGVLIVFGGLVGIAGIAILTANLYIQSKPTQLKIERKLSETLRLPLEIQRTSLTPWGGLIITGMTVPQSQTEKLPHFLEAKECIVHFQWGPLFWRKLVIDQILINDPKVSWIQNTTGRWVFPETESESTGAQIPQEPSATTVNPAVPEPQTSVPVKPFEMVLSRMRIKNGSFDFSNQKGRRIALFTAVNVEIPTAQINLIEGITTCEKISFHDRLFANDFKTHFSYSPERLALSELNAQMANGQVNGALTIKTSESKSPFSADVKFEKIDLNELLTEAGGAWNQAAGELSGFLDIYGQVDDLNSMVGSGQLVLTNGQFHQFELLKMLGTVLQIEELSQLNFKQATASWRIENGSVRVDQLVLQSTNLRLSAQGLVQLDGRLDLSANLTINQKISRQLPDFIESNFQPIQNSDLRGLDFKIFGTTNHPRTDLGTRILGPDIEKKVEKRAVDILHNIFGGKKRKNNPPPVSPTPVTP